MKENSNSQKTELTIDVDMGTAPVIKAQNDDMGTPLIKRAQHDCMGMPPIKAPINAHCAAKSLSKSNAFMTGAVLMSTSIVNSVFWEFEFSFITLVFFPKFVFRHFDLKSIVNILRDWQTGSDYTADLKITYILQLIIIKLQTKYKVILIYTSQEILYEIFFPEGY
jgi:hypothetical protein